MSSFRRFVSGQTRGPRRILLCVLLTLTLALALSGPAAAQPTAPDAAVCGTVAWVNPTNSPEPNSSISVNLWKNGTKKILDTPLAKLDFGGGKLSYAFCTDIYHARGGGLKYCLDSGFFSDWRVAWLVTHYPPTLNDAVQQAARQAAVWRYTDGWLLDQADATLYNTTYDTAVRNAYNAILAAIPASLPAEYQSANVQIVNDPASSTNFLPAQPVHPFTVRLTKGGYPLAGYTVQVSATLGTLDRASAVTDANGEAAFTLTSHTPGKATITATAGLDLPAGSRFVEATTPDHWQRLALGETTHISVQAISSKEWLQADNVVIAHKYEDRNGNGAQDEDEPNLAGWQFTLEGPGGTSTATTDSAGNAAFEGAITGYGDYTLTETLQSGWGHISPVSQARTRSVADPWTQWQADFGNAQYSLIDVDKFLDQDGDATWDAGEPPLAGWQFALYLWSSGDWVQHRGGTTGANGRLTFTDLDAGQYKVVEQLDNHPGYVNTTPLEQQVTLGYPARQGVRFGNRGALSLAGTKFEDANGNGTRDAGEPGLAGWNIRLTGGPRAVSLTATTATDGSYTFSHLEPGNYTLSEVMQPGWMQSRPGGPGQYAVTLASTSVAGYDFGNYREASLGDTVFYDDDRDGAQGPGELGIPGILVRLYTDGAGSCDQLVGSATTDAQGKYRFDGLAAQHYCAQVPESATDNPFLEGYDRTAGLNPREVTLTSGQNYLDADFGYAGRGTIRGQVFYDWNQDGTRGPSEEAVAGVSVCLHRDTNADGVLDATDPQLTCLVTDSQGMYIFNDLLPGDYLVVEQQPPTLQSTNPDVIPVHLVIYQGYGLSADNDFGEIMYMRLGDFVWLDTDEDGIQDAGETTGIDNVPVHITGTNVLGETIDLYVFTSDGAYVQDGLLPGAYTAVVPSTLFRELIYVVTTPHTRTTTLGPTLIEDLTLDFGYVATQPTGVQVVQYEASYEEGRAVLRWVTAAETPEGFRVWRSESVKMTSAQLLTQAPVGRAGTSHEYVDKTVKRGRTYWYALQDVTDGTFSGPRSVTTAPLSDELVHTFLPLLLAP